MTVYVDDMQKLAQIGQLKGRWSHLMADTTKELVEFALSIGLQASWIQHSGTPLEHFDVTDSKRTLALKKGAVPIEYGEGGYLTMAKRRGIPFDLKEVRRKRAELR